MKAAATSNYSAAFPRLPKRAPTIINFRHWLPFKSALETSLNIPSNPSRRLAELGLSTHLFLQPPNIVSRISTVPLPSVNRLSSPGACRNPLQPWRTRRTARRRVLTRSTTCARATISSAARASPTMSCRGNWARARSGMLATPAGTDSAVAY